MTHFRAVVVSDDYEKALRPYDENNKRAFKPKDCTDEFADKTREQIKICGFEIAESEKDEKAYLLHKQNYALFDGDKLVKGVYFCNPNAKYDYYADVTYYNGDGSDHLVFKKEYEHIRDTNEIKLKYIDFPATMEKEREKRRKAYQKYVEVLGHVPNFKTWDMLKKEYGEDFSKEEKNRDIYWNQPDVKAYNDKICSLGNPDEYMCTEEEFVNKTTYPFTIFVTDKKWIAKHEVGWFAVTYDEIPAEEYNRRVDDAVKKINPETSVHIMDCHI